jgi:uncharacterized membrane protein
MGLTLSIVVLVISLVGLIILDVKTPDKDKWKLYLTVVLAGAFAIAVSTISSHIVTTMVENNVEYNHHDSIYKVE